MKKILCIIGCVLSTFIGMWLALIGFTTDSPKQQGWMLIFAAITLGAAILFAGYGNSLTFKDKNNGKR